MFAKLKVSELKAELKKHGLKTSGKKDILIRRLESFHDDSDKQPEMERKGHIYLCVSLRLYILLHNKKIIN